MLGPLKDDVFGVAGFAGAFGILERPCARRCGGGCSPKARTKGVWIHETSLSLIRSVRPVIEAIARHDAELARQLRRVDASLDAALHSIGGALYRLVT